MKLFVKSVVIYLHILSLVKSANEDSVSDFILPMDSNDKGVNSSEFIKLFELENIDKMASSNYVKNFITMEYTFVINLGIKVQYILYSYQCLMIKNSVGEFEELESKINPLMYEFGNSIKGYIEELNKELRNAEGSKFDDSTRRSKDPKSFSNTESIKGSIETVKTAYNIVSGFIINSSVNEELKRKLLWTVKNKTVLFALGLKIRFLKMVNDYSHLKNIRSDLIEPGINYLMVFEGGISKRILTLKTEEKTSFFNSFLENYESSSEELIQRVISQIKEEELVLESKEGTHKDFELMHKDLNEYIKPLITLSGAVIKGVSIQ